MSQGKKNFHAELEEQVIDFWQKSQTFEKSVEKDAPQGEYVFTDGPPFITGLPHYATLLPSIAKDLIPRYKTMQGYRVRRVWGWDCHGLPAENKVEQELELKNKKEIESLGVDKFVDACRTYVDKGTEAWEWYIERIGRWADLKNAYKTMNPDFMESVIWTFKELYNKGLIYEGYRSSLHCPRCATPLSKFEITMDAGSYKDVEDETVIVKFPLVAEPGRIVLVWTTTPWTLPGNFALAVGKKIDYLEVRLVTDKEHTYILAKEVAENILKDKKYKVINEFKGKELVGKAYQNLFSLKNKTIDQSEKVYKIYVADFVNIEEGTGVVHIAQNFGEDDFNFGQEHDLPIVDLMDEMGVYTAEAGADWQGLYFKKAGKKVMEILGEKLFASFKYTHSYPHCYRCSSSLIFRSQKAWYLKIDKLRKQLLKTNQDINWIPEYFKEGRFKYNLENAPDWCLSRTRYWGSPVPVWKCEDCGEIKVVGSFKEIEELSGKKITDLHRPGIDNIEFKCEKCHSKMKRVVEVLDCWFESGSVPHAQWHYPFEKKDEYKDISPADYIIEYTGQLRGWFYYLHVISNALFNKVAFKNVIVTGVLAGTDGRKMSKSFGNYPDPKEVLDKFGADALRMYFMTSQIMLAGDMNLSERDVQDSLRKNVMLLWNVNKFYELFAAELDQKFEPIQSKHPLDKWILVRFQKLLKTVTENLNKYDLPGATRPIPDFIDELSTWYVRLSRDRLKGQDLDDKKFAVATLYHILLNMSKVIAPVMPFVAEQIWQRLTHNDFKNSTASVHLEVWPEVNKKLLAEDILVDMQLVKDIAEKVHSLRDEAGVKLRQPLLKIEVEKDVRLADLLKQEINVKEIVKVKKVVEKSGYLVKDGVALQTELTPELMAEGDFREVVRAINSFRKKASLTPADKITLSLVTTDEVLQKNIKTYQPQMMHNTVSVAVVYEEIIESLLTEEVVINKRKLKISFKK